MSKLIINPSDRTALTLAIGSHLHLFCQYHHSCTTLHLGELLWLPSRLCDIPWRCCDLCCISHHIPLHQGPVFCSENNTMLNNWVVCPGGFKLHFPTFTPTCSLPTLPGLKQPKSGLLVACGPQVSEQPNTSCVQIYFSLDLKWFPMFCPSLELDPQTLKVLERLHWEWCSWDVEAAARRVDRVFQAQGFVHSLEY